MPQLIQIQTDLSGGKELMVRQKTFTSGFASVEIDIRDKESDVPTISFFLTQKDVKDLIKFLTTPHAFTHDMTKL